MSLPNSILAYQDIQDAFDKALDSPRGIKVSFDSKQDAIRFLQKSGKFRRMKREDSMKIYPPEHPMHGKSAYDAMECRRPGNGTEVLILKISGDRLKMEEIGEDEAIDVSTSFV